MNGERMAERATEAGQGLQVLLIEHDAEEARRIAQQLSATQGLVSRVSIAHNLVEARSALRRATLDVCLLDLGVADAQDLCTISSGGVDAQPVPIIALSHRQSDRAAAATACRDAQNCIKVSRIEPRSLARSLRCAVEWIHALREAREAVRSRDLLLGTVAHDLRDPLNTILMSVQLLLDDRLPEEKKQQQLQIINRSVARMNRLVEDLLDVSRIRSGRMNLRLERQDPWLLVSEAAELHATCAAAHSIRLETRRAGQSRPILADRDRLMQVLSNLIGNSIKFTPPGGTVELRVESVGESVKFSVRDTGSGIAPDEIDHLFEPFWRGRSAGKDGAGLGLPIAREIVEAHGGRIWPQSVPGVGTTISFTIPVAPVERAIQPERRSA